MNYKNLLIISLALLTFSISSFATIYSDAEDETVNTWHVSDNTPQGATVSNTFDKMRDSQVIELKGKGRRNSYMLGNKDWDNTLEKNLEWSMKFSEKFKITVYLSTDLGQRTIFYNYKNYDKGFYKNKYIKIGLGSKSNNGTWQTFSRNIETDLKKYDPNNNLLAIRGFKVQGSGRIDDVKLVKTASPLKIFNTGLQKISDTHIKIFWSLTQEGTGQIKYGTSPKYGQLTKKENSFKYTTHRQNLRNLQLNTIYHYRIISEDKNGNKVTTFNKTFSTNVVNNNTDISKYAYQVCQERKKLTNPNINVVCNINGGSVEGAFILNKTKAKLFYFDFYDNSIMSKKLSEEGIKNSKIFGNDDAESITVVYFNNLNYKFYCFDDKEVIEVLNFPLTDDMKVKKLYISQISSKFWTIKITYTKNNHTYQNSYLSLNYSSPYYLDSHREISKQ